MTPRRGHRTCRYKLIQDAEDFERVIEVLKAHNVVTFSNNGGNDSMDTATRCRVAASAGWISPWACPDHHNDVGDTPFSSLITRRATVRWPLLGADAPGAEERTAAQPGRPVWCSRPWAGHRYIRPLAPADPYARAAAHLSLRGGITCPRSRAGERDGAPARPRRGGGQ